MRTDRRGFFAALAGACAGLLGWRPAWYASRVSDPGDWEEYPPGFHEPSIHQQPLDGSVIGFAYFPKDPQRVELLYLHERMS